MTAPLAFTGLNKIFGLELQLSKSGRGQIREFLGLMIGLFPSPGTPSTLIAIRTEGRNTKGSDCGRSGDGQGLASRPPNVSRYLNNGEDRSGHAPPVVPSIQIGRSIKSALALGQNGSRLVVPSSLVSAPMGLCTQLVHPQILVSTQIRRALLVAQRSFSRLAIKPRGRFI